MVAPGYRSTDQELKGGLDFLRAWGLVPRVSKQVFGRDLLCANTDEARLTQLSRALLAPDSNAVWCVRGGYGSIRLVPGLQRLRKPKIKPKVFIGLSDITTLHLFLNQNWGWPSVHGPLLDRLGRKAALPRYERELKRFVFGELDEIVFPGLKPLNAEAKKNGVVRGPVSGGNLTVLQSSLMGEASWDTDGRILFFEDIGERAYRVDRMLEQMLQAGLFKRAKAIVFGQFTGGNEADGKNLIWPVIRHFAAKVPLPVFSGLPSGHDVVQRPLPLGAPAVLRLGARGELVCETGCL